VLVLYLIVVLIFVVIVWGIAKYNSLIQLCGQVTSGWKQINVQLDRRHDLMPNLVQAVKGEMQFGQDTLQKVIEARNAAISAKGIAESAGKEDILSGALSKLFAC
jgi:LemA protein